MYLVSLDPASPYPRFGLYMPFKYSDPANGARKEEAIAPTSNNLRISNCKKTSIYHGSRRSDAKIYVSVRRSGSNKDSADDVRRHLAAVDYRPGV